MNNVLKTRKLSVKTVCDAVVAAPGSLIEAEEKRYHSEISAVAERIHAVQQKRRMVLLCGPSSSGKTTTAALLKKELARLGTTAHVVSLDDFYLGKGMAPLLPSGKLDYETIDALDVARLFGCVRELVENGKTELPIFDFRQHSPKKETVHLKLEEDAAVIFEGIHAFHPRLQSVMPKEGTVRLFINTLSRFVREGEMWFARKDIRLIRRILRDDQFRASPFSNTMEMWPQVVRGEEMYMFPYVDTADCVIDTTFAYEPCIFKAPLLSRLEKVPDSDPNAAVARRLQERLAIFPDISLEILPQNSILREFTG